MWIATRSEPYEEIFSYASRSPADRSLFLNQKSTYAGTELFGLRNSKIPSFASSLQVVKAALQQLFSSQSRQIRLFGALRPS